ncbi:MAG: EAL domain-containing protein [Labilithrix sp.]|nr:EAL domain-containing protein [Labilithrix sp.]
MRSAVVRALPPVVATPAPPPREAPARPQVLLIEDDALLARSIGRELAYAGTEVTHAGDGATATAVLRKKRFDFVLSDINLPDTTGVDLLRLVRASGLDLPYILMTGNPTLETATEAVELGALFYLSKPLTGDKLRGAVERAMTMTEQARTRQSHVSILAPAVVERAKLASSFESALEKLRIVFQPIVDARKRTIAAYEVLMRSDEASLPNPGAVLDAAERLDAIHVLGRRVRALAARGIEALPSPDVMLFVNLHPAELGDPELFAGGPLAPHARRIVLELTERAALPSDTDVAERTRQLREMGFRIAIDDLGAGYAGLTAFTSVEPEFVKLDMSLVRDIDASITKQRLVRSMVDLCRDLSMRLIAEGIETRSELACLCDLGCDLLQGYYLGKPNPVPTAVVTI